MIPVGTNLNLKNFPWATIALLFINWIIFVPFSGNFYRIDFWLSQYLFSVPGDQYPWQLITNMFFHADFLHILANSLFLLVFGPSVEDKLGWREYLFLYFLTGISANLVHGMMYGFFVRERLFIPSLGASGAISGVMGVYLYRCYYSKIKLMIALFLPFRIKLPAYIILPLWFAQDFMGGMDSIRGIGQNVAFWAHVGGFAAGFGACKYLHYEVQARREKLEFVAQTSLQQYGGYGEGIEATKKLLESDPENPELHLNLARAESRWWSSPKGREHYEKAIKLLLEKDPEMAAEVFIEYWKKYFSILEPSYQVRLSLLLSKMSNVNLAVLSLQTLVDSGHPLDIYMEQAHLNLAKIYDQGLGRVDLAQHVYEKFLQKFPGSKHRGFVEKMLHSNQKGVNS